MTQAPLTIYGLQAAKSHNSEGNVPQRCVNSFEHRDLSPTSGMTS